MQVQSCAARLGCFPPGTSDALILSARLAGSVTGLTGCPTSTSLIVNCLVYLDCKVLRPKSMGYTCRAWLLILTLPQGLHACLGNALTDIFTVLQQIYVAWVWGMSARGTSSKIETWSSMGS